MITSEAIEPYERVLVQSINTKNISLMKKFLSLLTLVTLLCGFTNAPKSTNQEKAMQSINGFYNAMSEFAYDKIGNYCTNDFCAIDNGTYYKNLGDFLKMLEDFEGSEFDVKMEVMRSKFSGKSGLIILEFDVDIISGEDKMHITALENYVMQKEKGDWLIAFIQSTPISPDGYAIQ
jgi:hypothetical protein